MLALGATGLLLAAAAVLLWHLGVTRVRDTRAQLPWLTILLLLLPGLACGYFPLRLEWEERELTRVASLLAERPVEVRCQRLGETFVDAGAELGYVKFTTTGTPADETLLKHEVCSALRRYRRDPGSFEPAGVQAVHVLTHEAMHLRGIRDEAAAECAAMQRDTRTATLLGAAPDEAARLSQNYAQTQHPRLPPEYRSGACQAGGDLDEGLPDPPWPPSP